jgi:hypothetical protein
LQDLWEESGIENGEEGYETEDDVEPTSGQIPKAQEINEE